MEVQSKSTQKQANPNISTNQNQQHHKKVLVVTPIEELLFFQKGENSTSGINDLILEQTTGAESKINVESEEQKEDANICFKCKGGKDLQKIIDEKNRIYDDCVTFENHSAVQKLILFKHTNHNLSIYYARRAMLSVLEHWDERTVNNYLIQEQGDRLIMLIKLLGFEAIFSCQQLCNSSLMNKLAQLLKYKYLEQTSSSLSNALMEKILNECIKIPLQRLTELYLTEGQLGEAFTGRTTSESDIQQPQLDFALKMCEIFMSSKNAHVLTKMLDLNLLYIPIGLIPVIKQNKQLVWGVGLFCLKFIQFFKANQGLSICQVLYYFILAIVKQIYYYFMLIIVSITNSKKIF